MPTFLITRHRDASPIPVSVRLACGTFQAERKRSDAAWLLFNREVDAMVRDHASLDTSHGVAAQKTARDAAMPLPGNRAVRIRHQNETVMVEAV